MAKFFSRSKTKFIVLGLAIIVLATGLLSLSSRVGNVETSKTLTSAAFSIGLIDDTTGDILKGEEADNSGLRTTKYYKAKDLEIDLSADAEVKYQVNYYDEDKNWLSVATFTGDYTVSSAGSDAIWVKIEIIPLEDDDGVVSVFEKYGYCSQIEIKVQK